MSNEIDVLNLEGAEQAARVAWVTNQIADGCHTPSFPPKPWAGRDEMLAATASEFGLTLIQAAALVDLAAIELCSADRESSDISTKRTMLLRLIKYRQILVEGMKTPRREITYKAGEIDENGVQGKPVFVKEKRITGVDLAAIGRLLEIERNIATLQGLAGPDQFSSTLSITEELDAALDGPQKRKVMMSIAQKIKNSPVGEYSEEGKKMIASAAAEFLKQKDQPKRVESTVIEDEDDDE